MGIAGRHTPTRATRPCTGRESVDYAVVMSGEIDMLLSDSEVHLGAGDVLVQARHSHAWVTAARRAAGSRSCWSTAAELPR